MAKASQSKSSKIAARSHGRGSGKLEEALCGSHAIVAGLPRFFHVPGSQLLLAMEVFWHEVQQRELPSTTRYPVRIAIMRWTLASGADTAVARSTKSRGGLRIHLIHCSNSIMDRLVSRIFVLYIISGCSQVDSICMGHCLLMQNLIEKAGFMLTAPRL